MPRFVDLDSDAMTEAQRSIYDAIKAGPRGSVPAPFRILLQSPELCDRAQKLGAFARYETSLTKRLSELAILVTARAYDNAYEWHHHVPEALAAGVPEAEIRAIARRQKPAFTDKDAEALYDFASEAQATRQVAQPVFDRATAALGTKGVVELLGILGYYALLALMMNAFEVPAPGQTEIPLEP
jgi:4-carboxymuconolactone decarboxylase